MKTYKKKHIGERGRKSGRERERGREITAGDKTVGWYFQQGLVNRTG